MASDLDTILQSLRVSYAKQLPDRIDQLRELWKERNAEGLQLEAHKLRGSGESYGFPEISSLCTQLESAAELSDWAEISQIIFDLDEIVRNL
jgi:HPt (histidine-containing phosphotransfer) domain-containing protein